MLASTPKSESKSQTDRDNVKALKQLLSIPISSSGQCPTSPPQYGLMSTTGPALNVLLASSPVPSQAPTVPQRKTNVKISTPSKGVSEYPSHDAPFSSSPPSSSSESEPKSKNTHKKSKSKSVPLTPVNTFYAGSAFQNSPDPLSIPHPDFDDMDDFFLDSSARSVISAASSQISPNTTNVKTESLLRILNIGRVV